MAKYKEIELPGDLYYDRENHIWAKLEDGKIRCGVDQFGQKAAGSVAYLKIKPKGGNAIKLKPFGTLEAGKYIGPLKSPVGGTILEVNQNVLDNPSLVNTDPYGAWMVLIEPSNLEEDLKDLVHGEENVQKWLEADYKKYEEEGLFAKE
ncbi:MAG: glycine cleavage system protein H [bacterium]